MSKDDFKEDKQQIIKIVESTDYKVYAFFAFSEGQSAQISFGATKRSEMMQMVGELSVLIYQINERLNMLEKMESLQEALDMKEGKDDRVLN
jgi:hypothetical protein